MTINTNPHIIISAGEASGDLHGANLVKAIRNIYPAIKFSGMGGTNMQQAGVEVAIAIGELSIVGAIDIIRHFSKIIGALSTFKKLIQEKKPALVILVDYPGFNLQLAKIAKKAGVKVLYYISPKVWAWQQSRVKIIQKYVDLMAVIFPFEIEFYKKRGINAIFVGNPSLQQMPPATPKEILLKKFELNPHKKIIGLFPGSRRSEIKYHLPLLLETAKLLEQRHPNNYQFILPVASSLDKSEINNHLINAPITVHTFSNQVSSEIIQVCDAIIAASGTVTLEIALHKIPFVIIYKSSLINYWLAKLFIKIPYLGLCNILLNKSIVKELLQYDAQSAKIAEEITEILQNSDYRDHLINELSQVQATLTSLPTQPLEEIVATMANL